MQTWIRFRRPDGDAAYGRLDEGDADRVIECDGPGYTDPRPTGNSYSYASLDLLAPCQPGKIVALWNNFHALAARLEKAVPVHPLFLLKPASSLAGPGDGILRPSGYTGKIAYEGELGIVIGRECRNVPLAEAASHIFGYTIVNDVTASELLNADPNFPQWTRAKGSDTFGCVGPAIVSGFDWRSASVVTRLDGVERQHYPLSDIVFSPEEQVSLLSRDMTLMPGDVIAVGTSIGVGSMKEGSVVEVSIRGIGSLVNHVRG
ncbi:2-keto-4-pentenoate hydratase/2-oxohepta-3-ene-1,7-dioic acid hydratase (catechol pathway) [Cupriavidus sp. OV038]|uniref:fumarylacetoacetate hydrolase family protein n=1 Tax=unclassified Cupriavidus TaxID=2640874 RepID=UPI0008E5D95E|nr:MULTISPECIES: fumarylacetoacetate hydrolase family protein [unclassified Cupriavidus]SFD23242.1 2-keto-4-pentenoate hydratase/2-oxohepta-3-ene-1,7-dioic acid hydratase (catechol pathway) [Cupriavidus sp. OV038]SFP92470.1 2-keto-4-pentenoate hydratase/2-oxohepta-3-ene-1,7-dioic acid hydratase (catechol pathway) [Cupriavidus sp. OV096]